MPRHMSFALTKDQVRHRLKTVTRRLGWRHAAPGMLVQPVEKCQGLKKGETVRKIGGLIRIVSVRREPLGVISGDDVEREGFITLTGSEFVDMFCRHNRCKPMDEVTRIEFEYVSTQGGPNGRT